MAEIEAADHDRIYTRTNNIKSGTNNMYHSKYLCDVTSDRCHSSCGVVLNGGGTHRVESCNLQCGVDFLLATFTRSAFLNHVHVECAPFRVGL